MSDSKLISPLLDGFILGNPMSEHDGVQCCPAIRENTDDKYIVKIVAIPATQAQMDALLLAGAYKDPADAMDYFCGVGEDLMKEAELLTNLSRLDGFLPYDSWQMEPITKRRLGYEVYLVGSYKRSLEKYVRRNPVTHLEAINMGLDMCAALTICRQAGALYVDLKPSNIFVSERKEYRIGDLGFIPLSALKYTALPQKYHSPYSPPELRDPMANLNLTADTFAVGMILYQLYNDGQLPFRDVMPEEGLPSPANADYELAEIIMKAIAPDPEQRWDSPQAMGQALAVYMQRNVVNDTPITHHVPLEIPREDPPAAVPAEHPSSPAPASEDILPEMSTPADETLPSDEDAAAVMPHELSDELSRMMSKADDLLAHEPPEGVVLPEVNIPDPFAFVAEDSDEVDDTAYPREPIMKDAGSHTKQNPSGGSFASQEGKKRLKKILSAVLTLLLLAGAATGGLWAYQNLYLQSIDSMTIKGERNQLTVSIETTVDESMLSVVCSDNYGNVKTQPIENGQAVFHELLPNTMYKLQVQIDGFHKLTGQVSDIFTTDATTSIVTFKAVTGSTDGSVLLNFTVDGEEPTIWKVTYSADGEETMSKGFEGHSVHIDSLAVGKQYTFTLSTEDDMPISGNNVLTFRPSRLILAQNLTITSNGGSDMTVHWTTPGDIVVESWNVRCYNAAGYEEQRTVNTTEVFFTGIDPTSSYTVEVMASGMTQPARTSITANPINITNLTVDESKPGQMTVNWEYSGTEPEGGWLLMYTIDGENGKKSVVKCEEASALISPRIPEADYTFTIQAADSTSIFSNVHNFTTSPAKMFEGNGLSADQIAANLLPTPEETDWRFGAGTGGFTTSFDLEQKISIVLQGKVNFYLPGTKMNVLYVIRDDLGNVLPDLISEEATTWRDLWYPGDYHYGELDLPEAPTAPGDYSLSVYFDHCEVATVDFTITE